MSAFRRRSALGALMSAVLAMTTLGGAVATPAGTAVAASNTLPTSTSAASLYLSNWSNIQALWMASHLNQNDHSTQYGPRIAELHYSSQWGTNQIVDYSGFFINQTSGTKYDSINPFASQAWQDESGVVHSNYTTYNGQSLPFNISRDYVLVPNEPFLVTRYTLTNPSSTSSVTVNVLDQVHLNNTNTSKNVSGSYSSTTSTLFGDMTASSQPVVFLGALQTPGSHQVGNDADSTSTDTTAGAWYQFDANGTLANNGSISTPNVDLGFQQSVTLAPNATQQIYFYLGVDATLTAAQADATTAQGKTGAQWYSTTATDYSNWLTSGKTVNTSDTGVNTAFERQLVLIKNTQNPTTALFPATSNPGSYSYKAWVRDSSFDAMALDASGHYSEAAAYWKWMASAQGTGGATAGNWMTTFNLWDGSAISFVQPEYDSVGLFLVGAYRHYELTQDATFLSTVWPAVQAAANFAMNNIAANGLGAADHSIWEQDLDYWSYTQALYVAGLRSAAQLGVVENNQSDVDSWSGAATTIQSSIQAPYSASAPGLWNDTSGYYNQAMTTTSNGPVTLIDGSVNLLFALGVLDPASERAAQTQYAISQALGYLNNGIARYQGDTYYNTSQYSPAGDEAGSNEPVWPELTMYQALYDTYTGNTSAAFTDLQWYASVSGVGYMPPGEAVSRVTGQPLVSTMSEPLTAASFLLAALDYTGQFDPRVAPVEQNTGTNASITVTTNAAGDWNQWRTVPYDDQNVPSSTGSTTTQIRRSYLANDGSNLYARVDNGSGSLPGYNTSPLFALLIYSADFAGSPSAPTTTTGYFGGKLTHPMTYMVGRWSNSNNYSLFKANTSGGWTFVQNLSNLAPQWDTGTGRLEAAVPASVFDSGGVTPSAGNWAYMEVELAAQNGSGTWVDDSIMPMHYRWTASGTAPLYGSMEGQDIYWISTTQARYAPSASVPISVSIVNPEVAALSSATLDLHFTHLGSTVGSDLTTSVSLPAGGTGTYTLNWTAPATDDQGYLVTATLTASNGQVLSSQNTAVDVSSTWNAYPRYGYLTNFGYVGSGTQQFATDLLNRYHLNAVQFYDWEWKSHVPLSGTVQNPSASWNNIANITTYRQTVLNAITAVHNLLMKAFQYNLIYGAWAGYGQDGSGVDYHWGVWNANNCTNQLNNTLPSGWATSNIYVFDPGNTSWQNYIFGQESNVFSAYGFDGWQMDNLGYGPSGTFYTCGGTAINFANEYAGFLQSAKTALNKSLIFNAVGNYAQSNVAGSGSVDAAYTEAWPNNGQTTYNDLRSAVETDVTDGGGTLKPIIAGYMDSTYSNSFTDANPGFFSLPGVLLTDAAIYASGGDHIELGDQNQMLSQAYYPNEQLQMSGTTQQAMSAEYDFITAYENVLRGTGLSDTSNAISITGKSTSTTGTAGTIWTFARTTGTTDVVHLINLLNNTSVNWQDSSANYPAPTVQQNLTVKYYYGTGTPTAVTLASPDVNDGTAQSLSFTTGSDGGGAYVQFTVPSLDYWDVIMVNK